MENEIHGEEHKIRNSVKQFVADDYIAEAFTRVMQLVFGIQMIANSFGPAILEQWSTGVLKKDILHPTITPTLQYSNTPK